MNTKTYSRCPGACAALAALLVAVAALVAAPVLAQPVIVESGWTLLRTISFNNPIAAHYNPVDGYVYTGQRGTTDGLYRIDRFGLSAQISGGSNTAAIFCHPDSGHVYQSEDYGGIIYRTALGQTGRETWVSGFHSGDDDPIGMAVAPADYTGDVLAPGEALVVDRGNSGLDEIWIWSPLVPENEVPLHVDDGTLIDAVDVAIDATSVFVVDTGGSGTGIIWEVGAGGTLTALATSEPLPNPSAVTFDPWNGDLLVLDHDDDRVVRVDRTTGQVDVVLSGFTTTGWACLDISVDGRGLLVTDYTADSIYEFGRCDDTGPGFVDCDENGVHDVCDIALGTHPDCNANGVPDECDLLSGGSDDCNTDGIPDDCPVCPPVELIFVMDTSTSMDGEASALCGSMAAVVATLAGSGVEVLPLLLGICDTPGGAYGCLEDHISNLIGTAVPGTPPAGLEILGDCPGGNEVCSEDWGLATAVVAGSYGWQPEGESLRLVIPLFDEGAWCGDPTTDNDNAAVAHAITMAVENGVIVSPITGSGSSSAVVTHAQAIADTTGGQHFSSTTPSLDIATSIVDIVLAACTAASDCNDNGVLDECDITAGTSPDENENGVPDECEGVGVDPDLPRALIVSVTNRPNPFNPRTVVEFELAAAATVRLAVYNVAGGLVRTILDDAHRAAGVHTPVWNGVDEADRPVPAGVYFYRLQAGHEVEVGRMALVK